MARSGSSLAPVAIPALVFVVLAPAFIAPQPARTIEPAAARAAAAIAMGLSPLALEQPATAYDSVVAMLQSWLVGGAVIVLLFAAALVAATANPLSKRRAEVASGIKK